jgi:hypothetical protein
MVSQYITSAFRGLLENKMNNDEIRKKLETGGLYALCPGLGKSIDLAVKNHSQSMKERGVSIVEDFEPGTGGNSMKRWHFDNCNHRK